MGITIHYSFTLKKAASLTGLVNEVADICRSLEWKFDIINQPMIDAFSNFDNSKIRFTEDDIAGILFSPHEHSESVQLTFLPNGRTSTITNIKFSDYTADNELLYWAFTKTQFGGPGTHIAIVKLLKYLSTKYFSKTEVEDEGGYWETGNEEVLKEKIDFFDKAITVVEEMFSNLETFKNESVESLAARLQAILKEKLKGFNNGQ